MPRPLSLATVCTLVVALAPTAHAHRLDEYLQATRIALSIEQMVIELDLTPGAAIAESVVAAIDRDRDGRASPEEQRDYAVRVLTSARLEVDGEPKLLTLLRTHVPDLGALRAGMGTVRLEIGAVDAASAPGNHQLIYRNTHREDVGVYLVNTLTPATPRIRVTDQHRDVLQRELRLSYDVAPSSVRWPPWWAAGLGVAVACATGMRRYYRR